MSEPQNKDASDVSKIDLSDEQTLTPNAPKRRPSHAKKRQSYAKKRQNYQQHRTYQASEPQPKPGTPEFKQLQDLWYAKLKADGFNDLESVDHKGRDRRDWLLNGKSLADFVKTYSPETELYYRRLTHYLTHRPHWHPDAFTRFAARLHVQGISYRVIVEKARAKGLKHNANKWHVHRAIKLLVPKALKWNKTSPKGVDFVADLGE